MERKYRPRNTFGFRSAKPRTQGNPNASEPADTVKEIEKPRQTGFDYRTASLRIHGPVCGRCGREFSGKNLRLLTVHHKDGNHHNNPRDGSNWENLCIYCHDEEHSRGLFADYISSTSDDAAADRGKRSERVSGLERETDSGEGKVTLAEKLAEALKKTPSSPSKPHKK